MVTAANSAIVASIGLISGSTILKNTRKSPPPSTYTDSSNSSLTLVWM